MNPTPHIVESAFMLLAAFAFGGGLGFSLKRLFQRAGWRPKESPAEK